MEETYFKNNSKNKAYCFVVLLCICQSTRASIMNHLDKFRDEVKQSITDSKNFANEYVDKEYSVMQFLEVKRKCQLDILKFCFSVNNEDEAEERITIIDIKTNGKQPTRSSHDQMFDLIVYLQKYLSQTMDQDTMESQFSVYDIVKGNLESFLLFSNETNTRSDFKSIIYKECVAYYKNLLINSLANSLNAYVDLMRRRYEEEFNNLMINSPKLAKQDLLDEINRIMSPIIEVMLAGEFLAQLRTEFSKLNHRNMAKQQHGFLQKLEEYKGLIGADHYKESELVKMIDKQTEEVLAFVDQKMIPNLANEVIKVIISKTDEDYVGYHWNEIHKSIKFKIKYYQPTGRHDNTQEKVGTEEYTRKYHAEAYKQEFDHMVNGMPFLVNYYVDAKIRPRPLINSTRIVVNEQVTQNTLPLLFYILNSCEDIFNDKSDQMVYINMRESIDANKTFYRLQLEFDNKWWIDLMRLSYEKRAAETLFLQTKLRRENFALSYSFPLYKTYSRFNTFMSLLGFRTIALFAKFIPTATKIAFSHNVSAAIEKNIFRNPQKRITRSSKIGTIQIDLHLSIKDISNEYDIYILSKYQGPARNSSIDVQFTCKNSKCKNLYPRIYCNWSGEKIKSSFLAQTKFLDELSQYIQAIQFLPETINVGDIKQNALYFCSDVNLQLKSLDHPIATINITVFSSSQDVIAKFLSLNKPTVHGRRLPSLSLCLKDIYLRADQHQDWLKLISSFTSETKIDTEVFGEILECLLLNNEFYYTSMYSNASFFMSHDYRITLYAVQRDGASDIIYAICGDAKNEARDKPLSFALRVHNECLENRDIIKKAFEFDKLCGNPNEGIRTITLIFETLIKLDFDMFGDINQQFIVNQEKFLVELPKIARQYSKKKIVMRSSESEATISTENELLADDKIAYNLLKEIINLISNFVFAKLREDIGDMLITKVFIFSMDALTLNDVKNVERFRSFLRKNKA